MSFKWEKPWSWSPRTRSVRVGKLVVAYIHPEMDGGYSATINGVHLEETFDTLPEAKKAVEKKITTMIKRAYKEISE